MGQIIFDFLVDWAESIQGSYKVEMFWAIATLVAASSGTWALARWRHRQHLKNILAGIHDDRIAGQVIRLVFPAKTKFSRRNKASWPTLVTRDTPGATNIPSLIGDNEAELRTFAREVKCANVQHPVIPFRGKVGAAILDRIQTHFLSQCAACVDGWSTWVMVVTRSASSDGTLKLRVFFISRKDLEFLQHWENWRCIHVERMALWRRVLSLGVIAIAYQKEMLHCGTVNGEADPSLFHIVRLPLHQEDHAIGSPCDIPWQQPEFAAALKAAKQSMAAPQ